MKRSLMQAYVTDSRAAVALYQRAFGAVMGSHYPNPDGSWMHCEVDIYGQILAVSEAEPPAVTGGTM